MSFGALTEIFEKFEMLLNSLLMRNVTEYNLRCEMLLNSLYDAKIY